MQVVERPRSQKHLTYTVSLPTQVYNSYNGLSIPLAQCRFETLS